MDWIDVDVIKTFFGNAIGQQITQFTIAFGIAAWFHSTRVRKEIALQSNHLIDAVNNLAMALRQDLTAQAERIGAIESIVGKMNEPKKT